MGQAREQQRFREGRATAGDASPAQVVPSGKPAVEVLPVSPTWKEPAVNDHGSSGHQLGSDRGSEIDWGSPRLEAEFGPLKVELEWSQAKIIAPALDVSSPGTM